MQNSANVHVPIGSPPHGDVNAVRAAVQLAGGCRITRPLIWTTV
jgi:hypothetical protein